MSVWIKQGVAYTWLAGPFVDDTDGKTAEPALTIAQVDIRLSKNGGDPAQSHNGAGATHNENGYYDVPFDTTDTNTLGTLKAMVRVTGALPVWETFMVVAANVWDSFFGADRLQVDVQELGASVVTAAALAADAGGEIADAVWDELLAGHAGAGSTGEALAAAGGVTPPTAGAIADAVWDELLGDHTGVGSTGEALADAAVPPTTPPTADTIADTILQRDSSLWEAGAAKRSLGAAVMASVHKIDDDGAGHMVVYRSDDVTEHYRRTIVTNPALEPIDELDKAV